MDEIELLRTAVTNASAFAELYRLYVTRVYRYHMAHVGIAKDAEELTSQTFMAALEGLGSFHKSGSFAAWLLEIATQKRLHDSRGNRRELPMDMDAALYYQNATFPTDRGAMRRQELEATSRALKQISPDPAEAIILTYFCDLSGTEVNHIVKKSTAATQMLIAQGIQELRTHSTLTLDEENTEDEIIAQKLTTIASQITPHPHFISELEDTLIANHLPKTKRIFSLQQIASLAGWALLIAAGVFLLYWRVIPNSASVKPFIANTGNAESTASTESAVREGISTPSPTLRATVTRLPTLEYIVQPGDTCTYIADRFGVTIEQLITLNRLNDTCDIWIDQKLVVPILPTSTPPNN